jgi:outer membrane receptor for ferric coprogen and ferric-rhodotorulic acid
MTSQRGLRPFVLFSVLSITAQVQAQDFEFNLPSLHLSDALQAYGRQTNLQVLYRSEDIEGKFSRAVQGVYSSEKAIILLLDNTGLKFSSSGNTITIYPETESDSTVTLQATNVSSKSIRDLSATDGTGSYTQTGSSGTATGLALTLRETPQSVTVVTRQKMDDFGLDTFEKVIDRTPGLYVHKQGDQTFFMSRGETIKNFQTDGNRQQQYSIDEFTYTSYSFDDMSEVDRVEVLKGSSGLLTGDGNPSATVNKILKKPTATPQASVNLGAGSWDTYRADIDVSGPINNSNTIRGRAVYALKKANSYKDSAQSNSSSFYGTVDMDITPYTLLNVGVVYKERESLGSSWYYGTRAYDTFGNFQGWTSRSWNSAAPWSGYKQYILDTSTTLEHQFNNNWTATLKANRETIKIPENKYGVVGTSANDLLYTYVFTRRTTDQESTTKNISLKLEGPIKILGREHEIISGLDYSRYKFGVDYERAYPTTNYNSTFDYINDGGRYLTEPSDGDYYTQYLYRADTIRRGAFAASRINLADDIKVILGARISDYIYHYDSRYVYQGANSLSQTNQTETGVVTPYAGLVYDIYQNYSLYASYASVFQPVSVQDENGRTLAPSEGVTYEIGSKAEFYDGRLNASLSYFWKRWENTYEVSGGQTPTGETAYRNVNGVLEHGYEFELSGELADGWQAQGGYVMNNSGLSNSTTLPKHQFKLNTTYTFNGYLSNLTIGGGARWQSAINSSGFYEKLKQSPYWIFDFMARYKLDDHWSTGFNANNVFDKKYLTGLNARGGSGEYYNWGEPRNLSLNIRYNF